MRWRLLLLGLAAFLIALLTVLPASWVAALAAPPQVQCGRWSGSVWRGDCQGLVFTPPNAPPVTLDSFRWRLQPAALLRLAVRADFALVQADGTAQGRIELRRGRILLGDAQVRTLLDKRLLGALPPGWHGQLDARELQLDLEGNTLHALSGNVLLHDLQDARGNPLGSYRLVIAPATAAPFRGTLADEGGPLQLSGEVVLEADRSWMLEALATPRPDADPGLRRQLELLGGADASGRHRISVAGSFR